MDTKSSFLSVRTVAVTKAAIALEAKDAGMTLSDYVLAATLKENAARAANRAGLPSHNQVAAEDYQRRVWFCGSPTSPDAWRPAHAQLQEHADAAGVSLRKAATALLVEALGDATS